MADNLTSNATGLVPDGTAQGSLGAADFTATGETKTVNDDLRLVVQSANHAKAFLETKQWNLLWRDADLLFQAPRPMTVHENTYILEPNVQRFTVAKIVNSVVPQLYKGLFYDDPPMLMRPRPGTAQEAVDARSALFSLLLDKSNFKMQTRWGLETMATFGTGIWKWGYNWEEIVTYKRTASADVTKTGPDDKIIDSVSTAAVPTITETKHCYPIPFFEHRPLDKVLVDPKLAVSDIRKSSWVVDVQYMDFYQLDALKKVIEAAAEDNPDAAKGWTFPKDVKSIWNVPVSPTGVDSVGTENLLYAKGAVHHAQEVSIDSPDPLRKKLEVLEYWDAKRKIVVLNGAKVLYSGENEFKQIPFLSANWWNRPKAFYGMGLGLIVGQNQRVDQGTINSILKILSYGVNPIYLKKRDSNNLTQMIRTGIGKVMTVDGNADEAFHLMETPKVPPDIWSALKESEQATESSSGADQQLVQGSTSGPRSSMGRTSGGAAIQASASATRMDGPLDNFIEQVFKPFLYILDMLVFRYMPDLSLKQLIGGELGEELTKNLNMQEYWDAKIDFEVLAGANMAAKRTMAQSMVMLTQILDNPQIQQSLADINEEFIDFKPIIRMWMEASEWKNGDDIIKKMTPEMKAKRDANSQAAQNAAKAQAQAQQTQEKFSQKQSLEDQSSNNRIKRDLVIAAAKANGLSETVEGQPSTGGMQGDLPAVA